jgi:dihydrofolate reductase
MDPEEGRMAKIIARLCMSADGVVERPDHWLASPDEAIEELTAGVSRVLVGRTTYERFGGSPGLDRVRKLVVASRPLSRRPNTEVLMGDPVRVLRALRQLPGEDLRIVGSVSLVRSLLRWGLVDEVSLLVHPVLAGGGHPLFVDRRSLRLVSVSAGASGVVEITYAATATSAVSADSAARWGGTWSSDSAPSNARTAVNSHA